MKTIQLMTIGLTLLSLNAFAGDRGHGGGSHFCPAKDTQESYDVYEGKKRYRLEFDTTQNSINEILGNAVKKIENFNYSLAKRIEAQIKFVRDPKRFILDPEIQLKPIPDANILMVDKNCEYRQLANWDTVTQQIFVDEAIYTKLPTFHKAALILHEAVYKVARDTLKAENSDLTRQLTAEILSLDNDVPTHKSFNVTGDLLGNPNRENLISVTTNASGTFEVNLKLNDQLNADFKGYQVIAEVEIPELMKMHQSYKLLHNERKEIEAKLPQVSRREAKELNKRLAIVNKSIDDLGWYYYDLTLDRYINDEGKIEIKGTFESIIEINSIIANGTKWINHDSHISSYGPTGNLEGKIRVRVLQGETIISEGSETFKAIRKVIRYDEISLKRREAFQYRLDVSFQKHFSKD